MTTQERKAVWPWLPHGAFNITTRHALLAREGDTETAEATAAFYATKLLVRNGTRKGEPRCQASTFTNYYGHCPNAAKVFREFSDERGLSAEDAPSGARIGYCGTHDPVAAREKREKKQAASMAAYEARRAREFKVDHRRKVERELVAGALAWVAGPRDHDATVELEILAGKVRAARESV